MSTPPLRSWQGEVTGRIDCGIVVFEDVFLERVFQLGQCVFDAVLQSLYSLLVADPMKRLSAYLSKLLKLSREELLLYVLLLIRHLDAGAIIGGPHRERVAKPAQEGKKASTSLGSVLLGGFLAMLSKSRNLLHSARFIPRELGPLTPVSPTSVKPRTA